MFNLAREEITCIQTQHIILLHTQSQSIFDINNTKQNTKKNTQKISAVFHFFMIVLTNFNFQKSSLSVYLFQVIMVIILCLFYFIFFKIFQFYLSVRTIVRMEIILKQTLRLYLVCFLKQTYILSAHIGIGYLHTHQLLYFIFSSVFAEVLKCFFIHV